MIKWMTIFLCLCLSGCSKYLFYPMPNHVLEPSVLGIQYENISINSTDGIMLHGWWLHAKDQSKATVLFFHGNAQNISTHIEHVYWLTNYGYDVVAIDYRGYGASQGLPSVSGSIDDIRAAIRYAASDERVGSNPIFVIGQSLGGSLAVAAMAADDIKIHINALIVISAFSDYRQITQDVLSSSWITWVLQWPLSFTVDNSYSPEKLIKYIVPIPVLIMHGNEDKIVSVSHAKRLYALAAEEKFIEILPGRHNNILNNKDNRTVLIEYLEKFMH